MAHPESHATLCGARAAMIATIWMPLKGNSRDKHIVAAMHLPERDAVVAPIVPNDITELSFADRLPPDRVAVAVA
jgi:hypothetical protein